jgi:hypothetical protein
MGFSSPGGGGGGGGGGLVLVDKGVVSMASSTENYIDLGLTDPTRNLWCDLTFDANPFDIQSIEHVDNPTGGSSVAAAMTWNDNQDQWSIVITTGSSASGDYRWFVYELPTE